MQFVYFIGDTPVGSFLEANRHLFPEGKKAQGATSSGPDGKTGGLVTYPDAEAPARLAQADGLTWEEVDGYWIGYDPENLPAPEDLARDDGFYHYDPLPLGDGRRWYIPTGRLYPDGSPLPKVRKVRKDGTVARKVKRKWHPLLKITDEVWEAFENRIDLDPAREAEVCRVALATNYRVGLAEISILELLDDQGVMILLAALVDRFNWPKGNA